MTVAADAPPASPPSDDRRWRQVDVRIRRLGGRPDALIEVLHTVQEVFGYLDDDALTYVSEALVERPGTGRELGRGAPPRGGVAPLLGPFFGGGRPRAPPVLGDGAVRR